MCVCGVCVCVCVWTFSKEVKLVGFFGSRGARPPVMTLPNKASHWRGSRVWSTLCTCVLVEIDYNMVNFVKTLVTRVSFLGFLLQAVGAYSLKMEPTSLSWTWHRTCYQSYISVYPVVDVRQGATGPGLRPWATPAQGKAWLGETKCRIYNFQPSNSSKYSS